MVSAARRQIIGDGAPINKGRRRRPQIGGGGGAALGITELLFLELNITERLEIHAMRVLIRIQ